jgi:hypothetical protein
MRSRIGHLADTIASWIVLAILGRLIVRVDAHRRAIKRREES